MRLRLRLRWSGRHLALAALLAACAAAGPPAPADLDPHSEMCGSCRMGVSDRRLAAQIVSPGELPLFFDEVGCLRDYLAAHPKLPAYAIAYVADHRTGAWIAAARAVYSRVPELATPMASHLVAHADTASRAADPAAAGGQPLTVREVFAAAPPPEGRP